MSPLAFTLPDESIVTPPLGYAVPTFKVPDILTLARLEVAPMVWEFMVPADVTLPDGSTLNLELKLPPDGATCKSIRLPV